MAEDKIKLPRSSYEELTKIIKTYGHMHEPVHLDAVSSTLGMHKATISANTGFLTQIDVLEPGQKKQLSPKGKGLAKALDFEMPNEIRRAWRLIVNDSDFLTRVLAAVRIRKGMDESSLVSHIAYSAGEPKKPYVLTGARTVADVLRAAELIQESDGQFVVTAQSDDLAEQGDPEPPDDEYEDVSWATSGMTGRISRFVAGQTTSGVAVNIEIRVECTPETLDDLGHKIRRLLAEIGGDAEVSLESDA